MPPALFFFLKISLAVLGLLWFHTFCVFDGIFKIFILILLLIIIVILDFMGFFFCLLIIIILAYSSGCPQPLLYICLYWWNFIS